MTDKREDIVKKISEMDNRISSFTEKYFCIVGNTEDRFFLNKKIDEIFNTGSVLLKKEILSSEKDTTTPEKEIDLMVSFVSMFIKLTIAHNLFVFMGKTNPELAKECSDDFKFVVKWFGVYAFWEHVTPNFIAMFEDNYDVACDIFELQMSELESKILSGKDLLNETSSFKTGLSGDGKIYGAVVDESGDIV